MAAFLDNCKFTPTAGGTTDWTYSAAVTGYQSPAAAGVVNGEKYKYLAISADLTQWEIGEGAYITSTGVLPRTTVLYNSSGTGIAAGQSGAGSKISFTLVPNVAVVGVKEDLLAFDEASSFSTAQQNQAQKNLGLPAALPGYLYGLTLSTTGSSTTFSVASGVATDGTAADFMSLTSAISKTTSAFAAGIGNGALDIGTIAASTWYWVFLIKNVSTQAVDILITKAVAATTPAPTLPSGYTLSRYIGSIKTNASSQWTAFTQVGSYFYWGASVLDVSGASPTNGADNTTTISVPLGIRVQPLIRFGAEANTSSNSCNIAVRSPDLMASEPGPGVDSGTGNTIAGMDAGVTENGSAITRVGGNQMRIYTNTSAQVVYNAYNTAGQAMSGVNIRTYGWVDDRGAGIATVGSAPVATKQLASLLQNYISGLTLSTAGASTTFSVATGIATDSTNFDIISLASAISKTTSTFAAGIGNGALDTGTIAANTWYHAHLIKNETNGAVDVLVSLSATAPTLPSGFTLARRVGSMKTNVSSQWTLFHQNGSEFLWDVPVEDVSSATLGTAASSLTLSTPGGVETWAIISGYGINTSAPTNFLLSALDVSDQAPGLADVTFFNVSTANNAYIPQMTLRTNTGSQIRARASVAGSTLSLITAGWIDTRGASGCGGSSSAAVPSTQLAPFMRSYLAGLTLSTAGSSATFSAATGVAADSTDADMMTLAASISKTASAFAAGTGNGALDTGTIAANTWYHAYLIKNAVAQLVDVLISLSASTPTMPSGYTLFRRVGSMLTNSSSQWTAFTQDGDYFRWVTNVLDLNASTWNSTAADQVLTVPTGVHVFAFGVANGSAVSSGNQYFALYDKAANDFTLGGANSVGMGTAQASNFGAAFPFEVRTDASAKVRKRSSDASGVGSITTFGWRDRRGKDA